MPALKTPDHNFDKLRDLIRSRMVEQGIPSLAVSVARNGEIIWEEAFGWADIERRLPATIHTPYSLASVSKPITTTAIMKLVEAGRIDLDKPVNDYLSPGSQLNVWIGDPKEVTVRRLASHTSGLTGQMNFYMESERGQMPPREESIRRYGNIITPPGERYQYANFGFGILDHIVARVSGLSFADFLRHEIFLPLGMNRSSLDIAPELAPYAASRYHGEGNQGFGVIASDGAYASSRYDGEGKPIPFYEMDHPGASSVWGSVHDLVRFGLFHLRQRLPDQRAILSDQTILSMQQSAVRMTNVSPSDLNLRATSQYGIGWVIDQDELDHRISHGGGMMGTASKILLIPEHGIVIATASNTFAPLAYTIERDILAELLPEYAAKFAQDDESRAKSDQVGGSSEGKFPVEELTGEWRGTLHTYEKELPIELSFMPTGGVHAKIGDQMSSLVNGARFAEGCLTGKMMGSVETADANRRPRHPLHHLVLDLKMRGPSLNGAIVSVAGTMLAHWTELHKVPSN